MRLTRMTLTAAFAVGCLFFIGTTGPHPLERAAAILVCAVICFTIGYMRGYERGRLP